MDQAYLVSLTISLGTCMNSILQLFWIYKKFSWNQYHEYMQVMDAGVVVEEGTHQELLAKRGRYAHMWTLQESEETTKMIKI